MSLLKLYHPTLFEVAGRRIDVRDFPDDVQVAWDDFAQKNGIGSAEFIERSGRILANAKGRGWFEWHAGMGGGTWIPAEKPGPAIGSTPGMGVAGGSKRLRRGVPDQYYPQNQDGVDWRTTRALWDVYSREITGYTKNLEKAMSRFGGKDWEQMIDGEWGQGTTRRVIKRMWDRFWTDHEAFTQLVFLFDTAQQGTADNYNRSAEIGPRFDWVGPNDNPFNVPEAEPRTQRILSSDYFAQLRASGGGSGM